MCYKVVVELNKSYEQKHIRVSFPTTTDFGGGNFNLAEFF
jgi:hypothetical protein